MPNWYPSDWTDDHGEFEDQRGLQLDVIDGPLAGRTAHVSDFDARLWVAIVDGRQRVTSGREAPKLPPHSTLLGYYVVDVDPRAPGCYWHHADGRRVATTDPAAPLPASVLERLRQEDERAKRPRSE